MLFFYIILYNWYGICIGKIFLRKLIFVLDSLRDIADKGNRDGSNQRSLSCQTENGKDDSRRIKQNVSGMLGIGRFGLTNVSDYQHHHNKGRDDETIYINY